MRILVTAGPTREPIDAVRFLSNRSTGRMGFALAREALRRGHRPLLVLGPVDGQPPVGAEVYAVETAREMLAAVLDFLPECDAVVCAAAVADVRPVRRRRGKIPHAELNGIALVANPDVAAEVGKRRGGRPFAIFALESGDGPRRARAKLRRKKADLCILNSPDAIGGEEADYTLLRGDGSARALGRLNKDRLARVLLDELGVS